MGVPGNANTLLLRTAAAVGGYQVSRSLRFNSPDSAYLSKNFASAGNRKTFTWSAWIKRSRLAGFQVFFSAADASSEPNIDFDFNASDKLRIRQTTTGGAEQFQLLTTQVFRDISAWYHIVIAFDTTQATASNRIKLYVNGSQVTAFDTSSYPSQNLDTHVTGTAYQHAYGRLGGYSDYYFDGYLAECHLIDGQQLDASSFGSTDATTGQWIPKLYSGSYGTNGFKLTFADNSAATAAALGKDTSGNGNNFSPSNFSVTAGAGNDSLVDTPTSVSATDTGIGAEIRGNYTVLNALNKGSNVTLANGNLESSHAGSNVHSRVVGTVGLSSGKWYYEATLTTLGGQWPAVGVAFAKTTDMATYVGAESGTFGYYGGGGVNGGGAGRTYSSYTTNDVIGVAIDLDNNRLTFYKNGANAVTSGTTYENLTAGEVYVPAVSGYGSSAAWVCNFGQRSWAYQAPAGFKALCDTNLPAPVVAKPNTAFDVVTYTGNGSARSITLPGGFSPDLIWTKSRSAAYFHHLYDIVRGTNSDLCSNSTTNELTGSPYNDGVTAFNSSGYSLGTFNGLNENGATYVAWAWDGGTSTVTNTQGSITSSCRTNQSSGFSVISYTANGTAGATIGHSLNVAPQFLIVKNRSGSQNWFAYHASVGATKGFNFNETGAAITDSGYWNNTAPTSTLITLGNYHGYFGSANFICYAWAPVAGYSSFGSYVGNGSSDGPFVYTGFRPRWVMIKASSASGEWGISDAARDQYNVVSNVLLAESSGADNTGLVLMDFTSNGFKLRNSNANRNANGTTYIYFAVAENPFAYARAR